MIGKLRGVVDSIAEDHVILDVNGVGYLVFCSGRTLSRLPEAGGVASLQIQTHVREDHISLYGFADAGEKHWFELLTTVKGVGNRIALAILSGMSPDQMVGAIAAQDKAAFKPISGVGPKLAERLIIELKDKVASAEVVQLSSASTVSKKGGKAAGGDAVQDAVSALANLGYSRTDAFAVVTRLAREGEKPVQELIRLSLRELAS